MGQITSVAVFGPGRKLPVDSSHNKSLRRRALHCVDSSNLGQLHQEWLPRLEKFVTETLVEAAQLGVVLNHSRNQLPMRFQLRSGALDKADKFSAKAFTSPRFRERNPVQYVNISGQRECDFMLPGFDFVGHLHDGWAAPDSTNDLFSLEDCEQVAGRFELLIEKSWWNEQLVGMKQMFIQKRLDNLTIDVTVQFRKDRLHVSESTGGGASWVV